MKKHVLTLAIAFAIIGMAALPAVAQTDLIPSPGFEIDGYIAEGITKIGGALATITGGFFSFLVIRKVWRWSKGM